MEPHQDEKAQRGDEGHQPDESTTGKLLGILTIYGNSIKSKQVAARQLQQEGGQK